MLITIAIPTYNNERTIFNAIRSALNQDYNNDYEVLIVNNASKDNTQSVIESFSDKKIRVINNSETFDMYSNHNICLKEAKGDYVLFCHSDDELLPIALSVLSDRIKKRNYPARYILWGHSLLNDYYPCIQRGGQQINTIFSGSSAIQSFIYGGLTPSGTCYSRKSILDLGGFPTSSVRSPEMDWVILILATYNLFEFEMVDRIYFRRTEASTAVRTISNDEWREIHKDAYERLFSLISDEQKRIFINTMLPNCSINRFKALKSYIPESLYAKMYLKRKIKSYLY